MTRVCPARTASYVVPDAWTAWVYDGQPYRRRGDLIEVLRWDVWWEVPTVPVVEAAA